MFIIITWFIYIAQIRFENTYTNSYTIKLIFLGRGCALSTLTNQSSKYIDKDMWEPWSCG